MCGLGDVEEEEFAAPGDSFFDDLEKENERLRRENNRRAVILVKGIQVWKTVS